MCLIFKKVEESFNVQATHDLLYKPWTNVSTFDHIEFPGVVPRTFIGPILLSVITKLPATILHLDSFSVLRLVRTVLGILTVLSVVSIRRSLAKRCTSLTGTLFTLITLTQFHILFYASRTLPNTFALILTNFAFADRLRPNPHRRPYRSIALLSIACALFRSELCTYIFFILLTDVFCAHLNFFRACAVGISAAVSTALSSIALDSYFWNRLCYPELEVFYFNAVLNKSSAWGTYPFHWYFTNALPRALGGSYILGLIGVLQQPYLLNLFVPAFLFVCVYSILPHKELRFIFYALPVFNTAAAIAMENTFRTVRAGVFLGNTSKHDQGKHGLLKGRIINAGKCLIMTGLALATLTASALQTVIATKASHWNYPSGNAMRQMHFMERKMYNSSGLCDTGENVYATVHIDVDSAMNGITRYLEDHTESSCPKWIYSKKEDVQKQDLGAFTHLISEKQSVEGFCVLHVEKRFARVNWREAKIELEPHTFIHRRESIFSTGCRPS